MKQLVLSFLIHIVLITITAGPILAQEVEVKSAQYKKDFTDKSKQLKKLDFLLDFANELYSTGDYYRAVTEYKRYLFNLKKLNTLNSTLKVCFENLNVKTASLKHAKDFVDFKTAISMQRAKQYELAVLEYDKILSRFNTNIQSKNFEKYVRFNFASSNLNLNSNLRSLKSLEDLSNYSFDKTVQDKIQFMWTRFYLSMGDIDKAKQHLNNIKHSKNNELLTDNVESIFKVINDTANIEHRSPIFATVMSAAVPTSGLIYTGHTADAVTYLILSSIFGFLSFDTYDKGRGSYSDQKPAFIVSSVILSYMYISNLYASYYSAVRFNGLRKHEQQVKMLNISSENLFIDIDCETK